jgi:F0F1-type ATP synthase membrane subunit b/b'
MPQFDFYSFSGQVFWSLSGFFVFYFFVLRFYVTGISKVLKFRKKLVSTFSAEDTSASKSTAYDAPLLSSIPK